MTYRFIYLWLFANLILAASVNAQKVDFNRQVKPILSDRCYPCHGPDAERRKAQLRLDIIDEAEHVLSPAEPDDSELLRRIESADPDERMPPPDSNLALNKTEIETLRQWIEQGAKWEQHWSFVAPIAKPSPQPKNVAAIGNEIDNFVLARLEVLGLSPAPPASKEKLLRRVTFELTGLPPTLAELDAFLADESTEAYENVVERLLASTRFGERMASDWLDVARYSDTYGYQVDRDRMVWPWRDWVVRAFNANMHYDQFLIEQLAGDLLPNATDDQILATTFNRLNPQKVEGGSIEEEFRVEYVADRSQTVGMALMGLTVECARCHDHKFDPLSQKEYYQLFAFFNNIDEAGLYSYFDPEATPTPSLLLIDDQQKQELAKLRVATTQTQFQLAELHQTTADRFVQWLADMETKSRSNPDQLTPDLIHQADFAKTDNSGNELVAGPNGQPAIKLTGDDEVKLDAGKFERYQPFSVVTRIKIPAEAENKPLERAVIFHRSRAWTDSASRGYQLLIEDGRLNASLIHFWPGDAISIRTKEIIATDRWIHVAMTYDGSSTAAGIQIFVDGQPQAVDVIRDSLQKTIIGSGTDHLIIGARFRDRGFTNGLVADFQVFGRQLEEIEIAEINNRESLGLLLKLPENELQPVEREQLRDYFEVNLCPETKQLLLQLQQQREEIAKKLDSQAEIMVMRELPLPRPAFVLRRGAYDAPTTPVVAATPAVFPSLEMPADRPANRLDLAHWLTSGKHPLTSRVAVNRFWQLCFGQGLVRTTEDFGSQGAPPSHPELLDWLALDFQKDWDMKRAMKQIVMSNTYRQSTTASPELRQLDPNNDLLARAPVSRLTAEMIRDNVLFVSGLLVEKLGGAPVHPYEVGAAFTPVEPDTGEGLYRRSIYTYWKRTGPAPVMLTLDAAKRDVCQVKRERTSSPLQSLVLLNGPQFVEAARKLSEKLIHEHAAKNPTAVNAAAEIASDLFRILTSRQPSQHELEIVLALFEKQQQAFQENEVAAQELLAVGDSKSETRKPAELAAWTMVANTLMNFDECVMKR